MIVTIRARLLWLVGVALLPAIAIIAYDEYLFRQQVFRDVQDDARRVTSLVSQQVQAEISETGRRCRLLERLPAIQSADASASSALAAVLRESPQYTNIAMPDAAGRVVASGTPFSGDVSVADRTFFVDAVSARTFVTGTFARNPITGKPGLDMAYPLADGSGGVRGVIWVSLGLQWAAAVVDHGDLPDGAVLLVLDREGTVLMRSLDTERWVGRQGGGTEIFRRMRDQPAGVIRGSGVDGTDRIHAFTRIGGAGPGGPRSTSRSAFRPRRPSGSRGPPSCAISGSCWPARSRALRSRCSRPTGSSCARRGRCSTPRGG